MSDQTIIRTATYEDLDFVADLERAAFPAPWKREFFVSELKAPGRYNRIAFDPAGNRIGYLFAMYFLDEIHVNKIAVVAAARRSGIARQLMGDCMNFARENQLSLISLEVRQSNDGAQAFYRDLDFAPLYVRPNYYPDGEAAVVMTRTI
jgi:ribosomal-protein-alanine acetyltransferase